VEVRHFGHGISGEKHIRYKIVIDNKTIEQVSSFKYLGFNVSYCENWTINLSDIRKTESTEMKFLRSVAGYTLLDQKRSTDIRSELKICNLTERIEK
jgi:hypothetical protein